MLPNYFISSLNQTLTVGGNDTSIGLSTIFTPDGQVVDTADFAEFGRGIITVNPISISQVEFISFTGITATTPPTGTITGCLRGLSFKGNNQIPANQKFNVVGTPVIISWGTHNIEDVLDIITANYNTLLALIEGAVISSGVPASTTIMGISRLTANPSITLGTATITIASPAVITHASHGLTVNDIVQFTTTGTLPTGITASTPYYVLATGLTTNTFEISATPGGTAINTSGSQSGTQTLIKVTPIAQAALPTGEVSALAGNSGTPGTTNRYVTENSLTTGATQTSTTISFTASTHTIADSANGFVTSGFKAGSSIIVAGSASNNGTYTVVSVSAGAIVVVETLVNESAGSSVTISAVTAGKILQLSSSGTIPPTAVPSSIAPSFSILAGETIASGKSIYEGVYQSTPVSFDADITFGGTFSGTSTNFSQAFTIATHSNGYLVVGLCLAQGNGSTGSFSVSAMQYGGVSMTLIDSSGTDYVFALVAPTAGTANITFTVVGSGGGTFGAVNAHGYSHYNVGTVSVAHVTSNRTATITNTTQTGIDLGFAMNAAIGGSGTFSSSQLTLNTLGDDYGPGGGGQAFIFSGNTASIDVTGTTTCFVTETGNLNIPDVFFILNFQPAVSPAFGYARLATTVIDGLGNFDRANKFLGISITGDTATQSITVQNANLVTGLSGLTVFAPYYLTDTPGVISATQGSIKKQIGIAISATTLLLIPKVSISSVTNRVQKLATLTYIAESDGFLSMAASSGSAQHITVNSVVVATAAALSGPADLTAFATVCQGDTYVLDSVGFFTPQI